MADPVSQKHPAPSSRVAQMSDGLVMALLIAAGCATHFLHGSEQFYGENAFFESGQNLLLLLGSTAFFAATSRALDKSGQSIMWALTLVCFGMFLREVDVRETDLEPYLGPAFERRIPYLVLLVFAAALLLTVAMDLSRTWRKGVRWLFSLPGAWFVTGLILYAFGDASEKNLFTDKNHLAQMTEESAEFLGALFIFCAGYVTLRRSIDLTTSQRTLSPDDGR